MVDSQDDKHIERQLTKNIGANITVTEDNDIVFHDNEATWNYVGMDVMEAASDLSHAQPRSIKQVEELQELPQYDALMNAAQNRGIFLKGDELKILKEFDPYGVDDYLERSNALSPEHKELLELAENYEIKDVNEWSLGDIFDWKVMGGDIFQFKDQWVKGYEEVIKIASEKYNLPEYLVAGVAHAEVGGDPLWIDDLAYAKRNLIDNGKSADKTSFGNVSMQVRVAAETLGYNLEHITEAQKNHIINSLKDPVQNIILAAKHLGDLRDIDFEGRGMDELSVEQIKVIATRYNRGPHLSQQEIRNDMQYGEAITNRKDILEELLYD